MLPTALVVRNYRSFAGEHRLPLRRLTLLFGDNNAGKSALLRGLPLLAASSRSDESGPLAIGSAAASGGGFDDLKSRVEIPSGDPQDLALGLDWDNNTLPGVRFEYSREHKRIRVRRIIFTGDDTGDDETLLWVPHADPPLRFIIDDQTGRTPEFEIPFSGLRPLPHASQPEEVRARLELVSERLISLAASLTWLSGMRRTPARRLRQPAGAPHGMSSDGTNAAAVLFDADDVRERVSNWYVKHLQRELVIAEEPPDDFRVTLLAHGDRPVQVDLVDCGLGPIQVFPILVALERARATQEPQLLLLEEPESHLHPSLQHALALHVAEFVATTRHHVVVETHSRAFFLGVQFALVNKDITPDDVVATAVRSTGTGGASVVDVSNFDRFGRPDRHWPPNFFADDQRLARDIVIARRKAGGGIT